MSGIRAASSEYRIRAAAEKPTHRRHSLDQRLVELGCSSREQLSRVPTVRPVTCAHRAPPPPTHQFHYQQQTPTLSRPINKSACTTCVGLFWADGRPTGNDAKCCIFLQCLGSSEKVCSSGNIWRMLRSVLISRQDEWNGYGTLLYFCMSAVAVCIGVATSVVVFYLEMLV